MKAMKMKKILVYAAPVALAGFLYLGENTGAGEVLAKTIKTVVQTKIPGTDAQLPEKILDTKTASLYLDGDYFYKFEFESQPSGGDKEYHYKKYNVIVTGYETEVEVPDDPSDSGAGSKVVPTVDPEAEKAEAEKRRQEAAVKVQKEAEQKTEDFINEISKITEQAIQAAMKSASGTDNAAGTSAAQTSTAVIKTDYFTCFTQEMLKQLAANPNVNYEIHYRYQGKRYVVVIPAGTDYSQLKDSNGYYGFRYLDSIFGGYEEGTK